MKILKLEKINIDDIVVGEPLTRNIYDNRGKLLLRKNCVIESERQLKILTDRGLYHNYNEVPRDPKETIEQRRQAADLLDEMHSRLAIAFSNIMAGDLDAVLADVLQVCRMLQHVCDVDIDAAIGAIFIDNDYQYTIRHPIHVAVISEVVARNLRLSEKERMPILAAAVTENIAIIDLQEQLYHQGDPLTEEQKRQIAAHPERGMELLRRSGVSNDIWLKGVLHHHEAVDGSGYPYGLKSYAIPLCARIIAAGDSYSASISNPSYRKALSSLDAMRGIFLNADKRIESRIANMCVKAIGIYPPGIMVRLKNDEIGIVVSRGQKAHLPVVQCVIGSDGRPLPFPVQRNSAEQGFGIKEILACEEIEALNIDIDARSVWS